MAKFITKFLVVFSIAIAVASGRKCCLPGETLTRGEKCLNLATGEESAISLTCPNRMYVDKNDMEYFVNHKDQLQFPLPNRIVTHEPDSYCEDLLFYKPKNKSVSRPMKHVALICVDEQERLIPEDVYGYCMGVSAAFLIVTAARFAIGGLFWSFELSWICRDLFGKSIINLCMSLALGQLILMIMRLVPYSDMNWCAVRGFSAYYFILVSFFWMNAISIQILTSRNNDVMDKSAETRRYALYTAYAWGVPAIFTVVTAIINFMPGDHLKPGIGLNHCWFFDVGQQWEYMYSIMSVLTVVNIVVFASVSALLCCGTHSHSDTFKHKFANCIRLLIVMGIPWMFEMIGSVTPHHVVWEFIDLFNALQGVWIFIVLVVFHVGTKERPAENIQYKINIISAEPPYNKLEK